MSLAPDPALVISLLREGLAAGQRPRLTISSGSMQPLLNVGDQVEVESVRAEELTAGDLVVFTVGQALLTHRLRWMDRSGLEGESMIITRGDRSLRFDEPFSAAELLGRVAVCWRGNRPIELTQGAGRQLHEELLALIEQEEARLPHLLAQSRSSAPVTVYDRLIHHYFYGRRSWAMRRYR